MSRFGIRKTVCVAVVLLACARQLSLATHYVSRAGSNTPPYDTPETAAWSIADAIAVSGEWSSIVADEGVYRGNIILTGYRTLRAHGSGPVVIRGDPEGRWCSAITLRDRARIIGLTIDGNGCYGALNCAFGAPTVIGCVITGGNTAGVYVGPGAPWVESCVIRRNGYAGVFCSGGFLVLTDCILLANNIGVLPFEQTLVLVNHCTITDNFSRGVEGIEGELAIRHSIIWGNGDDLYAVAPWEVVECNVGEPDGWSGTDFSAFNGNISANPLFVGWGEFNDSQNPIYVDASHIGAEDGTKANPFRTIGAALNVYDYHLAVGSPCIGAASDGRNIGAFPDAVPHSSSGPASVLIKVRPGLYQEGRLPILHGAQLKGPGAHLAVISPARRQSAARLGFGSSIDGFRIHAAQASGLHSVPGSSPTIANCVISSSELSPNYGVDIGITWGRASVVNCLIYGMRSAIAGPAVVTNCTLTANREQPLSFEPENPPTITNSIVWGNASQDPPLPPEKVKHSLVSDPALAGINGNIFADPRFLDPEKGYFRLSGTSPCIDAGDNTRPFLPETDIAGMHRIMFGGKSLTVDMGAYEFYINRVEPVPGTDEATFTWSSLADRTYTIFYSDDLFNWHTAIDNFPSLGNQTTSWIDDGSLTGLPPSLVPRRFYRISENP